MSSSSSIVQAALPGQVAEKLTRTNYVLWRARVIPQLRGAGYFGYVDRTTAEPIKFLITKDKDGKEEQTLNPLHPIWFREGQQVLGYLLNTLTKEVLVQVTSIATPHELWAALAHMFSSQSRARVNNIRVALSMAQKGTQSVAAYFAHMRSLADELAAAGKPIDDDELVSYITVGLDMEYQPLVSANDARTDTISLDDLYAQMSNFDQCLALYNAAADGSYGIDTNWYVDSGATEHIKGELEKVTIREKYRGQDQVHTANGEGHEENPLSR